MAWFFSHFFDTDHWLFLLIHPLLFAGFALHIIWVRRTPSVALAWILIVALLPLIGLATYFLIGERPLGRNRQARIAQATPLYARMATLLNERHADTDMQLAAPYQPMARLATHHGGMLPATGNRLALYDGAARVFAGMLADIAAAQCGCDLEFYIWQPGGEADRVGEALMAAARRGVACRVLLDELGSAAFWRSDWPNCLQAAGVHLAKACRIRPLALQFGRADLRLHRKIVAIDRQIAWTGSQNLVDPTHFKRDAHVGQWVDAMSRIEGPAAEALATVFEGDWAVERGDVQGFNAALAAMQAAAPCACPGNAIVQVVPSGPNVQQTNVSQLLLSAILDARQEVVMTTPYFVPDDALLQGLQIAAGRGVAVTLIVPQRVDSALVRYASRSYLDDLLAVGVRIAQFTDGLLHTKSLVVDGHFSLFGSVNLDMRSLRLNYEISLIVYDVAFSQQLRQLQDAYLARAEIIDPTVWGRRSRFERLRENAAQLLSPLL